MERLGATVIPASTGASRRQLRVMRDYHTTVLVGSPFYALRLAEVARETGADLSELDLRIALPMGGERWSEDVRFEIERRLGVEARDTYGVSEVMAPVSLSNARPVMGCM